MLSILDIFFTVFHSALVLFVLFGWMHPATRKAHITVLLLTLIAWLLIGLYKGSLGYCPLTDWHWDVKRALGETNIPSSFTEYMAEKLLGFNLPSQLMNWITALGLVFGSVMAGVKYWTEKPERHETKKVAS